MRPLFQSLGFLTFLITPLASQSAALGLFDNVQYKTDKLFVRDIVIKGDTIFPQAVLKGILSKYKGQDIQKTDIKAIEEQVTRLYTSQGYINSGAKFPPQEIVDGVLVLEIIHGRLSKVQNFGNKNLDNAYVHAHLKSSLSVPFNVNELNTSLAVLQEHELVKGINARLSPTGTPGEAALELYINERTPYQFHFGVDNHQSPSIGKNRLTLGAAYHGLGTKRDKIGVNLGFTEGYRDVSFNYLVPVSKLDSQLDFFYQRSNFSIVEEDLKDAEIESDFQRASMNLNFEAWNDITQVGTLFFGLENTQTETSILGESLFPAESLVTTSFSTGIDWRIRKAKHRLSFRIAAEQGLSLAGATVQEGKTDGIYKKASTQLSYIARIMADHRIAFRLYGQAVDDAVLPAQKFAVGGMQSVRGYRKNMFVRDNGFASSVELYFSVASRLHLVPFFDYGAAWSQPIKDNPSDVQSREKIYSTGLGLTWFNKKIVSSLFWARPLVDVPIETLSKAQQESGQTPALQGDEVYLSFSYHI